MANTSIHFQEPWLDAARGRTLAATTSLDNADGIIFSRRVSSAPRISRGRSIDASNLDNDNEAGLRHPGDFKKKQTFQGTQLFFLAYQSIGVIYGDIGTSPLYVFSSTFSAPPARQDVIGVLSLIIWSLIMVVTIKYVCIILNADNAGEGGTFSCYSLLSRYANITRRDVREEPLIKMERYQTNDLRPANRQIRKTVEQSKIFKAVLKIMGVFAVTMVMSDGVLTPAQSVLGAVQGLNVIVPSISNGAVVGTTCGILVLLFVVQPFGTAKLGTVFAPIVIIWLGLLAAFGIYNLIHYDAGVFVAFNPGEAFRYLVRHAEEGWHSLGGVLLAFTGVEALFADLGAFSMRAIQISWLGYCLPCLLLAYIGQAAYLAVKPEAYAYPVFDTAPPGCLILSMVFAILAAIVASQAIITATFQLIAQIVKLSYFPQIQVKHTSKTIHSQLYVPVANYLLCIGTVIITAVFRNTTSLGQAYGVCVMFVTFFDTQMTTLAALIVWRLSPWLVALPWLIFFAIDSTFLSAALVKVPQGAWFTITLSAVLAALFILWRFGKEQQWRAERQDRQPISHYVKTDEQSQLRLVADGEGKGGEPLSVTKGMGIFFDKGGEKCPMVFSQFISKLVSKPDVTVFFHLRPLESPTVPEDERYIVQRLDKLPNCFRVVARYGYMDEVVTPDLASLIFGRLRDYIIREHANRYTINLSTNTQGTSTPLPETPSQDRNERLSQHQDGTSSQHQDEKSPTQASPEIEAEVNSAVEESDVPQDLYRLQQAYEHRVLYIIGKEEMHIAPGTSIWRALLLKMFLFIRENTRNKMANVKVHTSRLVEIGFMMEV